MTLAPATPQCHLPAAGRYRLDPDRSGITFRTRHLFGLAAVNGVMRLQSGTLVLDPAAPQAWVTATVSADSLSTGNARRDRDLRSARFLDVERYPTLVFHAADLHPDDARWALTGTLTVRDITRPVVLRVEEISTGAELVRARATTRIDRYALGVAAMKGMAARYLDVAIDVTAIPQHHEARAEDGTAG